MSVQAQSVSSTATAKVVQQPIAARTVIDFHCHHVPQQFELTAAKTALPNQRARWDAIARKLCDEDLLLKDIREGHLSGRVVNIPAGLIADADGRVPHETIMAINDHVADLMARHPGRIYGLASVDAYDGDRAAREAERAIGDLGLLGLFVDCARGDVLIDAPQARPTLQVAAKLGVPVFIHPVAPQPLTRQMTPYGVIGTLFARGTVNSASLIALLEGGVFSELPDLRVMVTGHAIGGVAMVSGLWKQSRLPSDAVEVMRRHVFIDTQMIHPVLIRASVDLLGEDRVMAGSDWPIVDDGPIQIPLAEAMHGAGLTKEQQEAVAADNCRRALGLEAGSVCLPVRAEGSYR